MFLESGRSNASGKQIFEFVGLRAKLYVNKMLDENENKKMKEVSKNAAKKEY